MPGFVGNFKVRNKEEAGLLAVENVVSKCRLGPLYIHGYLLVGGSLKLVQGSGFVV